jgi:hypothetical protein
MLETSLLLTELESVTYEKRSLSSVDFGTGRTIFTVDAENDLVGVL